tara:strand:+ start:1917 stop:2414 length:498 start_codon:yes stop_codon:yes gene_type:complete
MLLERILVFIALALFLLLATYPIWKIQNPDSFPKVSMETRGDQCVAPADYMRENHMKLLEDWRDTVVRDGDRFHIMPNGTRVEKSLTKTCLGCHVSKKQFCEECHTFVSVKPYCWECHLIPMNEGHNQFTSIENDAIIKKKILKKFLVKNELTKNNPIIHGVKSD